ncbi:MAG: hypothetical protein JWR27_1226 [Aeromicrobium sp.]|nr:hypothetical protein [Aeromicrobium sp.]
MLTRTTARRTAAVLMAALVAVLLVATGGSVRAAHQRVSAGPSHASVAGQAARHTTLTVADTHDRPGAHLDLTATPASEPAVVGAPATYVVEAAELVRPGVDAITAVGRAPPAP